MNSLHNYTVYTTTTTKFDDAIKEKKTEEKLFKRSNISMFINHLFVYISKDNAELRNSLYVYIYTTFTQHFDKTLKQN